MWGCISFAGLGPIVRTPHTVNAKGYLQILQENLSEAKRMLNLKSFVFQDDNSRVHRANLITSYKEEICTKSLEWPSNSPDINPT